MSTPCYVPPVTWENLKKATPLADLQSVWQACRCPLDVFMDQESSCWLLNNQNPRDLHGRRVLGWGGLTLFTVEEMLRGDGVSIALRDDGLHRALVWFYQRTQADPVATSLLYLLVV